MLMLLPPSEGKTRPARGRAIDTARWPTELAAARTEVLGALTTLCAGDVDKAAAVLKVGAGQHDDVRRNATLATEPTAAAEKVYSGVLYEHLDLAGLDAAAHRRALSRVRVTSALFGLVRLGERIPAYRLSGAVSLPGVGPLPRFWQPRLAPLLEPAARRGLVVDLRSSTYAGFWRPSANVAKHVALVRVLHERDGVRSVVSHFNKATKGRLVRALLEAHATPRSPGGLARDLERLGWTVELGDPSRAGVPLDIVVTEL